MADEPALVAPHRAYELMLDLHADSRGDLLDALSDIIHQISIEDRTGSTSGGSNRGWHWTLTIDPDMTHDRFIEANTAYVKALHAKERADV